MSTTQTKAKDSHTRMGEVYHQMMAETNRLDQLPDHRSVKALLLQIADRVVDATSFDFESKSGERIAELSADMKAVKIRSGFNDWKYWNGVIHLAFLELAERFKAPSYQEYVLANYEFTFRNQAFFEQQYVSGNHSGSMHQFFRLDRLDDCGAMDAGLIAASQLKHTKTFESRLERVTQYITKQQDRLPDGTFSRTCEGRRSVWADDAYMSIPFLVRRWQQTGEDALLEDAVQMALHTHKHLFEESKGLYYHCYYPDLGVNGVAHWGRANGWVAMAYTELLKALPKTHPDRDQLLSNFNRHLTGLTRYQDAGGMWHQLLDKQDSFLESSGTAMFCYAMAVAIHQGWLDNLYTPVVIAAWQGLTDQIRADGTVDGISLGFNLRTDLPFYYRIPPVPDDPHGIGAVLMAGMAMLDLEPFDPWVWK